MREQQGRTGNEIAVVGMAGRFPGARSLTQFWRNLQGGVESVRRLSHDELKAAGVPESLLADPNYVPAAPILDDMEYWDAPFWGFTPLDASIMDPQHRLFLECAWEAFEDAGHAPERFGGTIGVFAGCGMGSYMARNLLPNARLMNSVGLFLVRHTGNDKDFLATRLSYQLNLTGPSVSVQTACSTSLVAAHLGAQSLLNGECDLALAGGVTIEIPHYVGYLYKENEILAPDGHCRAFDASSRGTLFGSGCGVILLRRLEDALRDGDRIRAVILGSAVNNDGSAKVGYLAPSVDGQAASIVEALTIAGVSPDSISYVETHGTGTPVGDPIEVAALTQAFRTGTRRTGFCGIGSLKSNIGHLDTAAGVASLIKTALSLENQQVPPSLHFKEPNPAIDFASSPFYVNAALREWQSAGPRRAGVSSLGVGGTNAHFILEEAPEPTPSGPSRPWQLLTLSARTRSALDTMSANLADHLVANPELTLADASFTLTTGRQALKERRVLVAHGAEDARVQLDALDKDLAPADTVTDAASVAFLFAGGGAQYAGMGEALYHGEPVFRAAVDRCLELLDPALAGRIRPLLFPEQARAEAASSALERPSLALPALFSTQYAMAMLLKSWGITPDAMIGHSMGEYTAAHLAGVFSLPDALTLVAFRGRLFETLPPGAMLSVPLPESELVPLLGGELSLAAVNAPGLSLASGPVEAIERLERSLLAREVEGQRLHISVAAHSAMLEPILAEFGAFFRTIDLREPQARFVSNLSGTWITPQEASNPEYWVRHLRHTVRFADGIGELVRDPARILLEVGPGRTLATLAKQHPDRPATQLVLPSMRHPDDPRDDQAMALLALGRLWGRGVSPDWKAFWSGEDRRRVALPTYPFERQRHWIDAPVGVQPADADSGRRPNVADWFSRPAWRQSLPPAPLAPAQDRVLLFLDADGLAEGVAARLASAGRTVARVRRGASFTRGPDNSFTLNPTQPGDFTRLFDALRAVSALPNHVVWAWSADLGPADPGHALAGAFFGLLALCQTLATEDPELAFRLDVITRGAQRVGGEREFAPLNATAAGVARVVPREFPNARARVIDVAMPDGAAERDLLASRLADEIGAAPEQETVAWRGPDRYVQLLEPVKLEAVTRRVRPGGVYLITGGLGGIGYEVARHLAATARAKLVLLGRRAVAARARPKVEALEALGAEVMLIPADVTNRVALAAGVARARERFGTIHGVFHAAGTLDDSLMPLKTPDQAARVLAPKVQGTLALDAALGDAPLDLMVLFSSVSAYAGLPGQADYAAANAFLDAFAQARGARSDTFCVAVGWGAWREVGMAAAAAAGTGAGVGEAVHPVLGTRIWASGDEELFAAALGVQSHWILAEHRLRNGPALIPGSGYLEIAHAALAARPEPRTAELRDVAFMAPFIAPDHEPRELRVHLAGNGAGRQLVIAGRVRTAEGEHWQEHATALVSYSDVPPHTLDLAAIAARCRARVETIESQEAHPHLAFGPRWNSLRRVAYGRQEAIATLELPEQFLGDLETFALHPALMDMATAGATALVEGFDHQRDFYVPLSYGQLRAFGPLPRTIFSHIRLAESDYDPRQFPVFDVTITDQQGRVVVDIQEFMMARVTDPAQLTGQGERAARRMHARFDPPPAPPSRGGPDLADAIAPAEGVAALQRILDGPALPQVLVAWRDINGMIGELRGTAGGAPAGPATPARAATLPLDEIEAVLTTHEAVRQSVVLQRRNRPGELKLVAYVVFEPGEQATMSELRRYLKARLPEHLVPSTFVELEALPVLPDGAVDRAGLPDPFGVADDYVAPRTEMEKTLAAIWQDVLGIERVGVHDNFFDAGGHSLLAVRVVTRLDKQIGVRLNQAVMVLQTLEQIAAECEKRLGSEEPAAPPAGQPKLTSKLLNALRGR
jgi:acyl transferase domain-containing protein